MRKRMILVILALFGYVGFASTSVSGAGAGPENLVRILRTTNKAQTNKFVCEAFEFKNVNPYDVINFLWAPVSREEGGIYSYVNPDFASGYVVVICPEYQLDSLREMARQLDRPKLTSAPGSKYNYYRLKHRNVLDPGFLSVASFYIGSSGVLIPDVETNSVLIFDAPEGTDRLASELENNLDLPLSQIEVDVKLYDVKVNSDGTLGLDFTAWKNGPGKLLGVFNAVGETLNVTGGHSGYNQRGSGYYLDYPSAFFDFLVEKGKASVLTSTRVVAVNQVTTILGSGEQVLYYEVENGATDRELVGKTTSASVDGMVFTGCTFPRTISAVDTGVCLEMVPTIGNRMVNIDLDLSVVSLTGYDGSGRPTLSSRQMTDSIAVSHGDTVLFGGLQRSRKVQTTRKVPFLGSLPVIGYLFGGEITTDQKSIVVAALTPNLINGDNLTEADRALVRKANDDEVVVLPRQEFCFEQLNRPYVH